MGDIIPYKYLETLCSLIAFMERSWVCFIHFTSVPSNVIISYTLDKALVCISIRMVELPTSWWTILGIMDYPRKVPMLIWLLRAIWWTANSFTAGWVKNWLIRAFPFLWDGACCGRRYTAEPTCCGPLQPGTSNVSSESGRATGREVFFGGSVICFLCEYWFVSVFLDNQLYVLFFLNNEYMLLCIYVCWTIRYPDNKTKY